MKKNKYILSPYLFALTTFFVLLVVTAETAMVFMLLPFEEHFSSLLDMYISAILFLVIDIAMLVVFYHHSYEYWGSIILEKDLIEIKAPLRKTIRINYSAIVDIGIDYSVASANRQFWIYISKDIVPTRYTHQIVCLPISHRSIRVQYRKKVYDAMIYRFPGHLSKKMQRASTVLKLFNST